MQKLILGATSLVLSLSTPLAFAHVGHDHGHWTSGAIHALWIGASLAVIGLAAIALKKRAALKKAAIKSEEE